MESKLVDIDYDNLELAKSVLDLHFPVKFYFRFMVHQGGRYLSYGWESNEYNEEYVLKYHRISVASDIRYTKKWDRLSDILWHELTHAKQKEEWGLEFGEVYDKQLSDLGLNRNCINKGELDLRYRHIPFEKEAVNMEEMTLYIPLAKAVNG